MEDKNKPLDKLVSGELLPEPEEVLNEVAGMPTEVVKVPNGVSSTDLTVAQLYASGKSKKYIASHTGLTQSKVNNILARPEIIEYVQELVKSDFLATKTARQLLLHKIIEDKVREVEEKYDGNFAKATNKDLLDVIKAYDDIMKESEKAALGNTDNTYVTLIQQIVKD